MSGTDVVRRLDDVERATSELAAAARASDPEAILRALGRRAEAIGGLRDPLLAAARDGALDRSALGAAQARLDDQARETLAELELLLERMRDGAERAERDGAAVRSYGDRSLPAAALDRSG